MPEPTGLRVVLVCVFAAAVVVAIWRRMPFRHVLALDATFIANTYPIVGLIYGVFLGFTIVITWGHFRDAEASTTQEVTRLSELWRDAQVLPEQFRTDLACRLHTYVAEVVDSDWARMAESGAHSPEATAAYEGIWQAFYDFSTDSLGIAQAPFYEQAVGQLNELGRERRRREHYAASQVHPLIRSFLVGGGVFVVLFSLLLPARDPWIQMGVTAVIAGLIASSIVLALALERPFSGELSVRPVAFETLRTSFEARAGGDPCVQRP